MGQKVQLVSCWSLLASEWEPGPGAQVALGQMVLLMVLLELLLAVVA